jgi:hypothetical protein
MHRQPASFALQLESFRSLARAQRSAADYRSAGVPAMWQKVGNGRWYRIVTGDFDSWEQATRFKQNHGLHDALIINAPWSVRVLPRRPGLSPADALRGLREIGHDGLMESDPMGDNEIYTGFFSSLEDAVVVAERINATNRFVAQVANRNTVQPLHN